MLKFNRISELLAYCALTLLSVALSCGKKESPSSATTDKQLIEIPFRATVGDEDFDCNKNYTLGTDNTQVQPKDFRYFVSDIRFIRADGSKETLELEQDGKWQTGNVALLDYATTDANCAKSTSPDSETRKVVRGVIKRGEYTGIEFALGLDDKTNHLDSATAQPPLNNPGMWWSWKGGYKEVRLELTILSDGAAKNKDYLVHHGATNCSGNSPETYKCTHENNLTVTLSGNPLASGVKFDIAKYFEGEKVQEELTQNLTTRQLGVVSNPSIRGCMAFVLDGDCEILFANLGLTFKDAVGGFTPSQKAFTLFASTTTTQNGDPSSIKTDANTCTDEKKRSVGDNCYLRDTALNVNLEVGDSNHASGANGFVSHNAGQACISCHQSKGPGKGLHTFSGTVYKADQSTPVAGAKVRIYNDSARTNLVKEFVTDKSGNFYSTSDYLAQLTNANKEYWVSVVDSDGTGEKKMMSPKITGQCSQCHVGGQRIWINK
ncbi:MAG: metallo-mystery pair system four-Cys motif protein [Betaproteobacteria bacterium]|nr:metallo-mystery pair system four-Cys motif protein [Betaproteobacteria bacterium]